jgi:hypothetical protein
MPQVGFEPMIPVFEWAKTVKRIKNNWKNLKLADNIFTENM